MTERLVLCKGAWELMDLSGKEERVDEGQTRNEQSLSWKRNEPDGRLGLVEKFRRGIIDLVEEENVGARDLPGRKGEEEVDRDGLEKVERRR